jgi:YcxB-like protein
MSADAPVFTLSYEAEPEDLTEWARMDPRRKRSRRRLARSILSYLVIVGAITVLSVVLNRPSAAGQGTPAWLYVLIAVGWLRIVQLLWTRWRLFPSVAGRRTWRAEPAFHGPHQEEVSLAGIRAFAPDQASVFYSWDGLTTVEETARAFYLHDRAGVAVVLPKRGLPDTSQIPELREFLHRAVADGQDPAAAAD